LKFSAATFPDLLQGCEKELFLLRWSRWFLRLVLIAKKRTLSNCVWFTLDKSTLSFTHNFVTHHLSTLSHTLFHTQPCHTPSFTHTTSSHIIFQTQLCHTPSFTLNFVTHHLSHTILSHTTLHIHFCLLLDPPPPPLFFLPSPSVSTFVAHYWKKLPCGVFRSFN
jgi:hypothetical protein